MAPVFVTTIAMPVGLYPSFAKIPTATATPFLTPNAVPSRGSAANTSSTPSSSTGLDIFLIISVVLVLLGTMIIVWLCFRRCTSTRVPPASEQTAVKPEPENAAGRPKMIQEAHIIPNTWDSTHVSGSEHCTFDVSVNPISGILGETHNAEPRSDYGHANEDERSFVIRGTERMAHIGSSQCRSGGL